MLNIRFEPKIFKLLQQESKRTGLSIAAVVNNMIKTILNTEENNGTTKR